MAETLTESIRRRLRERIACPECGNTTVALRPLGRMIDVPFTSLHRFLNGRSATSQTLDKIAAWLTEEEPR